MPFYSFSIGYYWPLKDIRRGGFSNAPSHQDLMESPILSQMEHDQILNLEGKSSIHTGEKLYTCCVCGQGFSESSDHTNHKCSHTGVKLWKCGDCGEEFISASELETHRCSHTSNGPFTCSVCREGFTQSSRLLERQLIHTDETISKPRLWKMLQNIPEPDVPSTSSH
ncbi:zinc finger protein 239-like isoform X3 [Rhincodon typus]|uniref:zinc finger protein 239-like isoform X3 n=1 Tax=Rhincodon typus TaxID=259920 RepID=UPI002030B789|nr:zinc finger protein 239-like isoform X3 [Rhincodon typus]